MVEQKIQKLFQAQPARDAAAQPVGPKKYILSMFPYPSGTLHMGHVRVYTYGDCLARFHRLQGKDVLYPIGWDSFGLPADNAARERNLDPRDWTVRNIAQMKVQLQSLGISFDWPREVSTCQPEYFRWTQWIFLQLHKKGLAYQNEAFVNWDPVDETVLANEQVDANGKSWRSGALVEKKKLRQWFFGITQFADPLLDGLKGLEGWPKQVKKMQELWIGRSHGMFVDFGSIRVFTTRPETLMGVSFVAVSNERVAEAPASVPHPITSAPIPVFGADYVLDDYGTGAVMGVPGHDARDAAFAAERGLPVVKVVDEEKGVLLNSGSFSGLSVKEGSKAICEVLLKEKRGETQTLYKLRDWLVSRQRPWGAPIPIVHCPSCGAVPVKEEDLPVPLAPRSDLQKIEEWKQCACPSCGEMGSRDTDTMDTFVDSSWYYLRYTDPLSTERAGNASKWMAVDTYVGGVEVIALFFHLLCCFLFFELFLFSSMRFCTCCTRDSLTCSCTGRDSARRRSPLVRF
jgi:leucyl-tRNA synthetase